MEKPAPSMNIVTSMKTGTMSDGLVVERKHCWYMTASNIGLIVCVGQQTTNTIWNKIKLIAPCACNLSMKPCPIFDVILYIQNPSIIKQVTTRLWSKRSIIMTIAKWHSKLQKNSLSMHRCIFSFEIFSARKDIFSRPQMMAKSADNKRIYG